MRCPRCHRRCAPGVSCSCGGVATAVSSETADELRPVAIPGYRIGAPLGRGGVASVWAAQRVADGHGVAIKVSHNDDSVTRERFAREAEALERIGPPFVPALHETGQLGDGRVYLVMEHLAGEPLGTVLERFRAPPPLEYLRAVITGLTHSLAAVHADHVVHRDLKPENIVVMASSGPDVEVSRVAILDFGLVRTTDSGPEPTNDELTRTGVAVGTLEYMAPEQLSGSRTIDGRTDLYALGVILFELFALRPPFVGDPGFIEYAHLAIRPPRPSRFAPVPLDIEEIILRCLAKEPEQRYPDIAALQAALSSAWQTADASPAMSTANPFAAHSAPSAKPKRPRRRKQTGVVLFVSGWQSMATLRSALESHGSMLGHLPGRNRAACVFTHESSAHPVKRALAAAQRLLQDKLVERAILDLVPMTVRSGGRRQTQYLSPMFDSDEHYPTDADPRGVVLLTRAARERLPDVDVADSPNNRRELVVVRPAGPELSLTGTTSEWFQKQALVGREALLAEILSSAQDPVARARASLITIVGDVGLGKTLIASVLVSRVQGLHGRRAEVIALRPNEPVAGTHYATARLLLRHVLQLPGALSAQQGKAVLIDKLGSDVASEVYESVGALLGWLSYDDPAVKRLLAAPGALHASAARAIAEGLHQRARERPLCVVLDDAQWADDATLDALEQATSRESRLWVCTLARPQLMHVRPDWGKRALFSLHEELQPLATEHAASLCRDLLRPAEQIPESVLMRLVDRARGNPLILVEMVRGLKKQGLLRRQHDTGPWYVASEVLESIPETPIVEWIATRELDALTANLAAHARLVSLVAAEFTAEEVAGVLTRMERENSAHDVPLDARIGLEMLVAAGLVTRMPGDRTHRFSHGVLRQGIAATTTEDFRLRVHRAAYRYYQEDARTMGSTMNPAERRARLAHHAARAGERVRAAAIYLELAEEARERHAYLDADLLYHGALIHLDEDSRAERQKALTGRGVVRCRLARYRDALTDLSQARDIACARGDRRAEIRLLMEEATALDWIDEWRRSRELAELARERAVGVEAPALHAWIQMALGRSACRFSDHDRAIELMLDAADSAESLGDEGYETVVISLMLAGAMLAAEGRLDESQTVFDRGVPLCVERRDDLYRASMLINRTYLWTARGDVTRLLQDLDDARELARRLGNANLERHAVINLAWYLHWSGRSAEAEPHARRALALDDLRLREDVYRPESKVLVARLRWAQSDQAGCRALVDEIRRQQAWATREGKTEALLVPSERVMFDMVLLALDGADNDAWDELVERARSSCQSEPEIVEVLQTRATVALHRGDRDSARSALEAALAMRESLPDVITGQIRRRLATL